MTCRVRRPLYLAIFCEGALNGVSKEMGCHTGASLPRKESPQFNTSQLTTPRCQLIGKDSAGDASGGDHRRRLPAPNLFPTTRRFEFRNWSGPIT